MRASRIGRVRRAGTLLVFVALYTTGEAQAQEAGTMDSALAGLQACVTAAEAQNEAEAKSAADRADGLFRELEKTDELRADALTGRARILTQCRIPFAPFMRQGELVQESMDLAQSALAVEPEHLGARFILSADMFYMPEFLNMTEDAIRSFETLIAQHGDSAATEVRNAYVMLGELYIRVSREDDAVALWRRGLERFPGEAALQSRLKEHGGENALTSDAVVSGDTSTVTAGADPASSAAAGSGRSPPDGAGDPDSQSLYNLPPIVVQTGGVSVDAPRAATRLTRIDVLTAPGGAADVLQVFQTMPGVTRASDGSDLYVRGGDPAETPVFVDGARLFHAGTFESLDGSVFGVLDPAVLRRAYFSSGGFSVRWGNALSGVVDVETDGRPATSGWRAGANLASVAGTARLPLGARTGAWSSVTLTDVSPLLWMQDRTDEYDSAPRAFKAVAGFVAEPERGLELRATMLAEGDRVEVEADAFGYRGTFAGEGTTRLATVGVRRVRPDGRSTLRATMSATDRTTGFRFGVLDRDRTDRSLALRSDGEWLVGASWVLRAGAEAAALRRNETGIVPSGEALSPGSATSSIDSGDDASHVGGYVEAEKRLGREVAVVAGLRADRLPGETRWSTDPRLAVAWNRGDWTVRTGAGIFHQGRRRIEYDVPDAGSPSGVPTRARHLVLGVQHDGDIAIRAEAYIKAYDAYRADGGSGPAMVESSARGIDLLARWSADALTGWLTWSLLEGEVELESGERVPAPAAITHSVTAVARRALGERWELGATARLASGRPYSPVTGVNEDSGEPVYGAIDSRRAPAYFRLDSRVSHFVPAGQGLIVVYVEALNLLNRRNVMRYTWSRDGREQRPVRAFFSYRTLVLGAELQF